MNEVSGVRAALVLTEESVPPVGRLWSVWDMLALQADDFYQAVMQLTQLVGILISARESDVFHEDKLLDEGDRKFVRGQVVILTKHLEVLEARVSQHAAQDAMNLIASEGCTWKITRSAVEDIMSTLRRELKSSEIFVVSSEHSRNYAGADEIIGSDVAAKFPSAAYDMEEAGKCLALSRPTASVFHACRSLEAAIRGVARCLAIPDPTRGAERN